MPRIELNIFIMDVDFRNGEWVMRCNKESWLTTAELAIILDELGYDE